MDRPNYPQVSEQITMPLPGRGVVQANVETVTTNPNGNYSWRGQLQGQGTDYPVVITYGNNSVFATITTANASYTMESLNGSGWVYKNPSEYELSKPEAKDFLEVPHEQQ